MSRAIKHAAWFSEVSSGVAAIKHEPAIDPTVLLYLLESFKLNKILSHFSMGVSTSSKHTPPSSPQQNIIIKFQNLIILCWKISANLLQLL